MLLVTKDIKEERPLGWGVGIRPLEGDQTALSAKVDNLMIDAPNRNYRTVLKRYSFRNQT
jgi:hypothetical protein